MPLVEHRERLVCGVRTWAAADIDRIERVRKDFDTRKIG